MQSLAEKSNSITKNLGLNHAIAVCKLLQYCAGGVASRIFAVESRNIPSIPSEAYSDPTRFVIVYNGPGEVKKLVDFFDDDHIRGITESHFGENARMITLSEFPELIASCGNSDRKIFRDAERNLDVIAQLKDDWNGNGAERFSENLVKKAREIIAFLPQEPFVSPTARGSIQLEYEKKNGEYLEFEMFEDRIECFRIDKDGQEIEEEYTDGDGKEKMFKAVEAFYEP